MALIRPRHPSYPVLPRSAVSLSLSLSLYIDVHMCPRVNVTCAKRFSAADRSARREEGLLTLRGCRRETNYFPQQHASMLFTSHNELFDRISRSLIFCLHRRIQNIISLFMDAPQACRYFPWVYQETRPNIPSDGIFPTPITLISTWLALSFWIDLPKTRQSERKVFVIVCS